MKKPLYALLAFLSFVSCRKDEPKLPLDISTQSTFTGIFETRDSDNLKGTVTLQISDGYYQSATNQPFGKGAGKLEANAASIHFIDTLFVPMPAIWGPSYVLSGEHSYRFDGNTLRIWKEKNVGSVHYELRLVR